MRAKEAFPFCLFLFPSHQVLPLLHPGRAPPAVLPVGPRDPACPEGALDSRGGPRGLGGDAIAAAPAEESLEGESVFFPLLFSSELSSVLSLSVSLSLCFFSLSLFFLSLSLFFLSLSLFFPLTRCIMSFLGGTVGMPWKGKSIVGISSKTSACSSFFFERRFFCFFFPLSRLPLLLPSFLYSSLAPPSPEGSPCASRSPRRPSPSRWPRTGRKQKLLTGGGCLRSS